MNAWGAAEEPREIESRLGLSPSDVIVKTIGHAVDQIGSMVSHAETAVESDEHEKHAEPAVH